MMTHGERIDKVLEFLLSRFPGQKVSLYASIRFYKGEHNWSDFWWFLNGDYMGRCSLKRDGDVDEFINSFPPRSGILFRKFAE